MIQWFWKAIYTKRKPMNRSGKNNLILKQQKVRIQVEQKYGVMERVDFWTTDIICELMHPFPEQDEWNQIISVNRNWITKPTIAPKCRLQNSSILMKFSINKITSCYCLHNQKTELFDFLCQSKTYSYAHMWNCLPLIKRFAQIQKIKHNKINNCCFFFYFHPHCALKLNGHWKANKFMVIID